MICGQTIFESQCNRHTWRLRVRLKHIIKKSRDMTSLKTTWLQRLGHCRKDYGIEWKRVSWQGNFGNHNIRPFWKLWVTFRFLVKKGIWRNIVEYHRIRQSETFCELHCQTILWKSPNILKYFVAWIQKDFTITALDKVRRHERHTKIWWNANIVKDSFRITDWNGQETIYQRSQRSYLFLNLNLVT